MLSFRCLKRFLFAISLSSTLCFSAIAYQSNDLLASSTRFLEAIEQIREISDTDTNQALARINQLKLKLNKQPIDEQLEYYHLLAEIHTLQGNYRLGKVAAEKGLSLASSLISPRIIIAKLSYDLGFMLESLGELEIALAHYQQGLDIAESLEEQKEIAIGLINIGAINYQTNRLSEAIVTLNEAATIADNLSDLELKGFVNSELGILYGALGKSEKAISYYEQSFKYYSEAGKPLLAVNNLRNAAVNYWGIGNTEKAIATYYELLDKLESQQQIEMQFSAHIGLAQIFAHEDSRNFDLAMKHLNETEKLLDKVEQHTLPLQFLIEKSSILKDLEQYEQALDIISQALALMKSMKFSVHPSNEARLLVQRSEIYRITGRFKEAYDTYTRVYEINMQDFENRQTKAIAELRLGYESQRVDLERNLLENKNKIESISLSEVKAEAEHKQRYIYLSAIVILIFAYLLLSLIKSQKALRRLSNTDGLTQVLNRRRFTELAEIALQKAQMKGNDVAVLLIDCDHFKEINDNYGHIKGDSALQVLGEVSQTCFDKPNLFARLGGEEFIALMPNTDIESAKAQAETFRLQVANHPWNKNNDNMLSVSCGLVTTKSVNSYHFDELFQQADKLLYKAKENGRNQVCV